MKPQIRAVAAGAAFLIALAACQRQPQANAPSSAEGGALTAAVMIATTPVIPRPAQVQPRAGYFVLDAGTRLQVPGGDAEATRIARDFAARVKQARGFEPQIGTA